MDPKNTIRSSAGIVHAIRAIRDRKVTVWIGPEGTRWGQPGQLGPFKPGAFRLAIEAGVPVVPVVISPLKPRTDLSGNRLDPNDVTLTVLPPISTAGLSLDDVTALRDRVRERMQSALDSRLALAK